MDILRKLQSILALPTSPEIRSRIGQIRPERVSPFSFDRTLGDAIQMDPVRHLGPIETGAITSGPIPIPPPTADLPALPEADFDPLIDGSHASTLEATIAAASRATATATAQPVLAPAAVISPASEAPAAKAAVPVAAAAESSGLWAPLMLRGSGAQGTGVDGSDTGATAQLNLKFAYYSEPEKYGISLNQEGRMFRDAVANGHVPNTVEGLGTVLGYLSMGSFPSGNSSGRPAPMTAYFHSFFKTDAQAYG